MRVIQPSDRVYNRLMKKIIKNYTIDFNYKPFSNTSPINQKPSYKGFDKLSLERLQIIFKLKDAGHLIGTCILYYWGLNKLKINKTCVFMRYDVCLKKGINIIRWTFYLSMKTRTSNIMKRRV